ncbi:hypothetical protein ERO13_D10G152401v2 [Gossypium hirsutum]|uniref:Uncharacterized protein n=2 Tax=Gossypium TaxID=3633 RepID=A0A5D2J5Y6_GOSTO|nr:hypothetical protein ERO13_D10G152401v2 [Gossypium hirsutum]TYG50514.1 hypothetical protein ES288_D10G181300v1 [Gossypium darwinii]TYH50130.1 hypothetical protein ES332_D10G183200v1 [Gossypium tomentosum]
MSTGRVAFIMVCRWKELNYDTIEMKFGLPRSIIYGSNQVNIFHLYHPNISRILADGRSSYVILQTLGQTGILYRQGRAFKIAFFHRKQIYQILSYNTKKNMLGCNSGCPKPARIPKLRPWQRCSRLVKEQGTIFYIIWRCTVLLLRWEEQSLEA